MLFLENARIKTRVAIMVNNIMTETHCDKKKSTFLCMFNNVMYCMVF